MNCIVICNYISHWTFLTTSESPEQSAEMQQIGFVLFPRSVAQILILSEGKVKYYNFLSIEHLF